MTLVFEQEFSSFDQAIYRLIELGNAIDTPYFPSGKTVPEFVAEFTTIQLGRRFTGAGWGSASLSLSFDENQLEFAYSSTSGTEVNMSCKFDDDMTVTSVMLKAGIPNERCHPGRCHYEAITAAVQRYDWYRDIGNSRAVKRGADRPVEYLSTPKWVLDYISNAASQDESRVNHVFSRYGFSPYKALGFKSAWKHEDGRIILRKRGHIENTFSLEREECDRLPEYWWSFRRICEGLRHKTWQKMVDIDMSKQPSVVDEDCEDYEDYEGCLDGEEIDAECE